MQLGVIGGSQVRPEIEKLAEAVGEEIGRRKAVLVCGGLTGVMEAAARGARKRGGLTVGILPGSQVREANPYIDVAIPTAMGHARNVLIVWSSDAVICIDGEAGTLSEAALSMKIGKPLVLLRRSGGISELLETLEGRGPILAETPVEAVERAAEEARKRGSV
jgi:hypothetical protein